MQRGSLLDGVELERAGHPAAVIVTAEFREAAGVARRAQGASDFPYADVRHPINTRNDAELSQFADGVVASVVRVLTRG